MSEGIIIILSMTTFVIGLFYGMYFGGRLMKQR